MTHDAEKPSNGTISERTKVPIKLGVPILVFALGIASWMGGIERQLNKHEGHLEEARALLSERSIGDRFRGADMDRWCERIAWAWQFYADHEDLDSYPEVPPWRESAHYSPAVVSTNQKDK